MRALLDLLVALRGSVTVAFRRRPAVLAGAGLAIVALVTGAVLALGGDGDAGGPPAGYELGAPGGAGDLGPGHGSGDLPEGDPLVNVLGARSADRRSSGAGAASAGEAGSSGAGAAASEPVGAGSDRQGDRDAGPGTTATDPPPTSGEPSFGSAPPPSGPGTTTTEPTADPGDGQGGHDGGNAGLLGGLLDVLGLG